jgi:uncharacterized protein
LQVDTDQPNPDPSRENAPDAPQESTPNQDLSNPPLLVAPVPPTQTTVSSEPPPLPATENRTPEPPPPPKPVSKLLAAATVVTGVIQLLLAIPASGEAGGVSRLVSYRIGYVLGGMVLWPLIVIGLFSLARRFRTTKTRLIILLSIWGLSILGEIGNLANKPVRHWSSSPGPSTGESTAEKSVIEPAAVPPTAVVGQESSSPPDLSPGSDERLIAQVQNSQLKQYQSIVRDYARGCAERPDDAVLALERVKFIEHFASSEDNPIENADTDLEAAQKYLETRFPNEPGTVLYLLQGKFGEKRETAAQKYEPLLRDWTPAARATFLFLRAQALEETKPARAYGYAKRSFSLNPTVDAGLQLAKLALTAKEKAVARETLHHPVFAQAVPWQKKRQMDLLLDTDEPERAVALYDELKAKSPDLVRDADTAEALGRAGRTRQAREIFDLLAESKWSAKATSLRRFNFELEHGDKAQASAAYRAMREAGIQADPFLRYRLALLLKYPGAGWAVGDLGGALMLVLLIGVSVTSPLLILVPVHYWSLLREKKGLSGGWPDSFWTLKNAWLILGTLITGDVLALWILRPDLMQGWTPEGSGQTVADVSSIVQSQIPLWAAQVVVAFCLVWRARAWRLYGRGDWSNGRAIGMGLILMIALRVALVFYVKIFPQSLVGEMAAATSQTTRLILELADKFGPFGMVAVVAVFVPLLEETVMRGILLQALGRHIPFWGANVIQAAVFALLHENYLLFPFFFAFGCIAGELVRRARSLLPALVLHAGNNAVVCIGLLSLQHLRAGILGGS